jgi:hypothetical protein
MEKPMRKIIFLIVILFLLFMLVFIADISAQTRELRDLLSRPFRLPPRHDSGEKVFFRIRTVYLDMDPSGKVAQTQVLEGFFSRERTDREGREPSDRFRWAYAQQGSRSGRGDVTGYKVLPFSKDFVYTFDEWTPEKFPVDLSTLPKTMDGWLFFVNLLDAHTFDVIVRFEGYEGELRHIGDSAFLPAEGIPVAMDFPPLFTDTSFTNAPFYTTFRGITLYGNAPCAVLVFRADDCRLRLTTDVNGTKISSSGVSYYKGEIFYSLDTGEIEWAQLWERVDLSLDAVPAPYNRQTTRREITLERLSETEYHRLVAKTPAS